MTSFATLDSPGAARSDPEAFLQDAMRWHFGAETGSKFWLDRMSRLDFDPRTDIKTFDDLKQFPNFTNDLRDVPIRDLIPQGYGPHPEVVRITESGGTSGAPKRVVILRDWWELLIADGVRHHDVHEVPRNTINLSFGPSGPHQGGEQWSTVHSRRGNVTLSLDLDPRWVKKLVARGEVEEMGRYVDHLVEQGSHHLLSQDVEILGGTPPLLAALCRHDELVERIRERVKVLGWGGAHMDVDARHLYRTEIFPGIRLMGGYGTTMALGGGASERPGLGEDEPCIMDPFSPYVSFTVVDPGTLEQVPLGGRGQLLVNHVSKSFFLPANLERDEATRVPGLERTVGDTLADISPLAVFEGAPVIEGVY